MEDFLFPQSTNSVWKSAKKHKAQKIEHPPKAKSKKQKAWKMARGRRFHAEGGEFDDVLDGKYTVVSDGGPYVYYFTHVERPTSEHPVMDGTAPGARMIEVGTSSSPRGRRCVCARYSTRS